MIKAITTYRPLFLEKSKPVYDQSEDAVYVGSTMYHPFEDDKFILVCNPMTDDATFIEFKKSDLLYAEESSSLTTESGESIKIVKIHIKVGSIAVKYEPFIVTKASNLK